MTPGPHGAQLEGPAMTARRVLLVCALALAFGAGRLTAPGPPGGPPALELRPGPPPWVEVWRGGVLASEWQPKDGATWRVLSGLLATQGESAPGE